MEALSYSDFLRTEQYYLAFPILLWLLSFLLRYKPARMLCFFILSTVCFRVLDVNLFEYNRMVYYFSTWGRVYQFSTGSIASYLVFLREDKTTTISRYFKDERSKTVADVLSGLFVIILLALMILLNFSTLYAGFIGSAMTFSLIILLEVSAEEGLVKRKFFHNHYLCLIGRYSYSMYLVHLPVTKIGDITSQIAETGPMRKDFDIFYN